METASHDVYEHRTVNGEIINVLMSRRPLRDGVTAADVRIEAQRRLLTLTGARDPMHLDIVIANTTRESVRLMRKGEAGWSEREAARAAELAALDEAIEAIRAASNAMEGSPPADYQSDARWPALPAAVLNRPGAP